MPYADYSFYKSDYLGESITEADFPALALRASDYLDRITFGRASEYADIKKLLAKACCAVAEQWQTDANGVIASQSVGSWSQSYAQSQDTAESRLYKAAAMYLDMTGLLVRWL